MAGELFIGLMSGTSLDGVDVALVEFNDNQPPHVLHTHFLAYLPALRAQILALQHPTYNELETTMLMGNTLARLYADAVNQLLNRNQISPENIVAIGCHGQTIRHRPGFTDGTGFTLQIGNAALLAELTGITVISDFRSRDIAAGGQGAPLVPAFHQAVFASKKVSRALINIGGIANITYLSLDIDTDNEVFGFDSGPGNMLLDAWIKQHKNLDYDANGAWASTGEVITPLLSSMLTEPYFALTPPKSTGRDLFNDNWLSDHLSDKSYAPEDVARTLVALTAHSIYSALIKNCGRLNEVYLCGGGAHNSLLKSDLQLLLDNSESGKITVDTTDALGIGVDWVEAIAFAWLAKQCIYQQTANLPKVTGAKGARILGAIYQN
ncbi:MAG TPA: anhydro-N-acetylmuramic acid kinase [Methylotenera sp.]|nr:anhydro-N-acetylmuramic acid kinase [Methylotenera sp.]